MCKFENENAPGFDLVVDGIQRYAEEAPKKIEKRWIAELSDRNDRRAHIIDELMPPGAGSGEFPAEKSRGLKLISPGSHTIMQTPPSDTASEFGRTPGKPSPLMLTAPEAQSSLDLESDRIEDREMVLD